MKNSYRSWDEAKAAGLLTKTQWSELGKSLKKEAEPVAWFDGWYDRYALYSESETRAKQRRTAQCYSLKDRGLVAAVRAGRIAAVGASGNLTVYRGEGYCYHSLLRPIGWTPPDETASEPLMVEAKPKSRKEPRLKDALLTLEFLPPTTEGFERIDFAPRSVKRDIVCYKCGEAGHLARNCVDEDEDETFMSYEDLKKYSPE